MKRSTMTRVVILIIAMLMTMAVTLAAEQKKKRPSSTFVVRGGAFLPSGDWKDGGFEPRENVEMALGYHFMPFLALEGGIHHFKMYMSETTTYYMDQTLYGNGVVLTPKLIYPGKRIELCVGVGGGYYGITAGTYVAIPGVEYFEVEDAIWGFHAVAGASYDLLRWLYLGLEGKYVTLLDFLDESDITGWSLTLGIGLRFW